jgi:hypothetical protein
LLIPFLLLTIINEGFSHYGFYANYHLNKLIFYNVYFFVQVLIIGTIYFSVFTRRKNKLSLYVFILILSIEMILLISTAEKLNPDYITMICLTLVILAFYYLYDIYVAGKILSLKTDPIFWFSIGLIIAQFLFLFYINAKRIDSFRNDKNSLAIFRSLNAVGNVIYYLCICYSFLCTSIFRRRAGT